MVRSSTGSPRETTRPCRQRAGRRCPAKRARRELWHRAASAAAGVKVQLLADVSDPDRTRRWSSGLLQKVTMTAAPDLMMQGGMQQFEARAGALTPEQRTASMQWLPQLKAQAQRAADECGSDGAMGAVDRDRRRHGEQHAPWRDDLVLCRRRRRHVPAVLDVLRAPAAHCSTRSRPARSSACSRRG